MNDTDDTSKNLAGSYLAKSKEDFELAGYESLAAGFSKAMGSFSTYQNIKNQSLQYQAEAINAQTQASEIITQVSEKVAMMRKQFASNVGTAMQGAANRGISIGSGVVQSQIEAGSSALGNDINTIEGNAARQAKQLKNQAEYLKTASKTTSKNAKWGFLSDLAGAAGSFGKAAYYGKKAGFGIDTYDEEE